MSIKDLEQERARFALEKVKSVYEEHYARAYTNLVKSFPALIMSNGLMQAMYFLAKESIEHKEYEALHEHVEEWLARQGLDDWSKSDEPSKYRLATEETMKVLKWLRQLADAYKSQESKHEGK
jgi:CRISPR type III-B/RAMP module-associated protein Cmr5